MAHHPQKDGWGYPRLYSPEELNQQENQRAWGSPLEIKATVLCQIRTPAILPFVQADFSFGFGSAEPKINWPHFHYSETPVHLF